MNHSTESETNSLNALLQKHNVTIKNKLGRGVYGNVYAARMGQQECAVKIMDVDSKDDEILVRREVDALKVLSSHPNVIRILSSFDMKLSRFCIVMERASIDLYKFLKAKSPTLNFRYGILYQILLGLEHAHEYRIVHRDLKPSNILMFDSGRLAIGDWGMSRTQSSRPDQSDTPERCSLWYRAFEVFFDGLWTSKSDVWSAGCVFYEVLTGKALFQNDSQMSMIASIKKAIRMPKSISNEDLRSMPLYTLLNVNATDVSFPPHKHVLNLNKDSINLIMQMLQPIPSVRWSCHKAKKHELFKIFHEEGTGISQEAILNRMHAPERIDMTTPAFKIRVPKRTRECKPIDAAQPFTRNTNEPVKTYHFRLVHRPPNMECKQMTLVS